MLGGFEFELLWNSVTNCFVNRTGNGVSNFEISNVELVYETLEFHDEASFQKLMANGGSRLLTIKSESYQYMGFTLGASSVGRSDLPFSVASSSLKSMLFLCSPSNAAGGRYASVNPNIRSISLQLESKSYPDYELQADNYSELAAFNEKNKGSLYNTSHNGLITQWSFRKASTDVYSPLYKPYTAAGANVFVNDATVSSRETLPSALTNSNMWYLLFDFERIVQSKDNLYAGLQVGDQSNLIRLDIASALSAYTHAISCFCVVEPLLIFDPVTGIYTVGR
jgi:hypothetical protein